jgi:hypothetical protein
MKYILCLAVVLCFFAFTWRWVMPDDPKVGNEHCFLYVSWSAVISALLILAILNLSIPIN